MLVENTDDEFFSRSDIGYFYHCDDSFKLYLELIVLIFINTYVISQKSGYKINNWNFDPDPKLGLTNMKSLHGWVRIFYLRLYVSNRFACGSVEGVSANGFIKVDPLSEKKSKLMF